MEVNPKFIVINDNGVNVLILMKVVYHKDIVAMCNQFDDASSVKILGGGWWKMDHENKKLTFYNESADYGKPSYEAIKDCCDNYRVYSSPIYNDRFKDWNFNYESYKLD